MYIENKGEMSFLRNERTVTQTPFPASLAMNAVTEGSRGRSSRMHPLRKEVRNVYFYPEGNLPKSRQMIQVRRVVVVRGIQFLGGSHSTKKRQSVSPE